jgi:ADP-heptose:LPS heptosyltransferase
MAAHAVTSVRQAYPNAFLTWAIESRCAPVVDTEKLVSLRHEFPRDQWRSQAWSPATWWNTLRTYGGLRKHGFDFGVDLQGHSKTALCLYLAKPKKRIASAATDSLAKRLNPVVEGDALSKGMHVVEWNLHVLRQLGDFPEVSRPIMPPLLDERRKVAQLLQSEIGNPKSEIVTISTGAGARDKQWPIERWVAVGDALKARGFSVYFLGGPPDPLPEVAAENNLVGKLPLAETMAAVAMSRLHLAGDTGTAHIAAAYGVPVVSVFGPTHPPMYRPYTDRGILLRNGKETTGVEVPQVIEAATTLLQDVKLS